MVIEVNSLALLLAARRPIAALVALRALFILHLLRHTNMLLLFMFRLAYPATPVTTYNNGTGYKLLCYHHCYNRLQRVNSRELASFRSHNELLRKKRAMKPSVGAYGSHVCILFQKFIILYREKAVRVMVGAVLQERQRELLQQERRLAAELQADRKST